MAGLYYIAVAGVRLAFKLPYFLFLIFCLPAMPFFVAYRNRKEHPTQAKLIYVGWGLIYGLCSVLIVLDYVGVSVRL